MAVVNSPLTGRPIPEPDHKWTFEDLHREGAAAFGWDWIDMNEKVQLGVWAIGEEPHRFKRLLSAVAYGLLAAEMAEKGRDSVSHHQGQGADSPAEPGREDSEQG